MLANPLLSGSAPEQSKPQFDPSQKVINLISNAPPNQISGLDDFMRTFNSAEVRAEVNPFRFVIQRKQRRSMGGKFSAGLSQEVTENVEINPNEDLFGLRRWLGQVRQDPGSLMLVNIFKIKEEALAAPLSFSEMIRGGRPVLITGADDLARDQLLSKIDLKFATIPDGVKNNPALKISLMARTQRPKGFISSIRPMLDLEFIPASVTQKLTKINSGGDPSELTEAEVINIALVGDMYSRYRQCLAQYKENLISSSLNIQQLTSLFELLMADVPLPDALAGFDEFMGSDDDRPGQVKSKAELFGYLNRFINTTEGSSRALDRGQKIDNLFRRITSISMQSRARVDPIVFERSSFIYNLEPEEKALQEGMVPVHMYIGKIMDQGQDAINDEFKVRMGMAVFELVTLSNINLEDARQNGGLVKKRSAQQLLPLFQMEKFQSGHLIEVSDANKATLLNKEKFIQLFRNLPITVGDLKNIWKKLSTVLNHTELVCDDVKRSTLDVIKGHAKDRDKKLREIYIVNACQELVNFSFHLGDSSISGLERLCGITVLQNRFGLEVYPKAVHPNSIGLFANPGEKPLGKLSNDPSLLSKAYTALVSLQIDRFVKKAVDHKIGYLQSTYGDKFFEVIYQQVVTRNDLPLSRNQLAWFVRNRGLLGNLSEKGWRTEHENDKVDTFLTLEGAHIPGRKIEKNDYRDIQNFEDGYRLVSQQFKQLMADLKASEAKDPTKNVHALIWGLFKKGIYNLNRQEAKEAFRQSQYYNVLKEAIARISSENYSVFTKDLQEEGIKIYLLEKHHYLLTIGNRHSFLIEQKVVRYQLLGSPATAKTDLDPLSRVFHDKLDEGQGGAVGALTKVGLEIERVMNIWHNYSRYLALALLDRTLNETVIKELQPGKIQPHNLWYLKDETKLCLGPAVNSATTVPFTKVLQIPENMGNIQKNMKSSSTTIDDFTIEVHKISRLYEEVQNLQGIADDILDIVQNMTHEKAESTLVLKYEQGLAQLSKVLDKPLRHISEKEVQVTHTLALVLRNTLRAFFNTPGSQKDKLVQRVQNNLRARRSDGHNVKLNFSDGFIIDKTEIKVMQKVQKGDETVSRQRKMEVEVEASHQTLHMRVREVIRTHQILARKQHIVLTPEGQKKNQMKYVMDIIETLQALRGNAINFYVDTSMIGESQLELMATRIKPHHFFHMDEITLEAPEGMENVAIKDPLTGRLMKAPSN